LVSVTKISSLSALREVILRQVPGVLLNRTVSSLMIRRLAGWSASKARGMGVMGARFALEVLEVVAAGEVRAEGDAVGLEEVAAGFGSVEDAQDAKGGECQVVNGFALAG
jgi:hypothetical protein